jgi:DNA-binding CsgD family transcriptional regulator
MPGHGDTSELVADIYDAALDRSRWLGALEKVAEFVGGPAASLFTRDAVQKKGNSDYYFGTEHHYKKLYFEKYFELDPLNNAYLFMDVGEVTSCSNIVPHNEFIATRFYQEWVKPQGIIDNVLALLDKTATSVAGFVVFRHESDGLADDAARQRMRLLVPHVRRAALISKVIDLKMTEVATLADTFDEISASLFLVDERGRVVHTNAPGRALVAEGNLLQITGNRLVAADAAANNALTEIFSLAAGGDAAVGAKGVAIPLTTRDGEQYVAHALPLTSGARNKAGATFSAVVAIFVRKAALEIQSPLEVIAKVFKLTPSELRVLLAIVGVGGVPEVSEALGVAESTVKTHLSRIYKKTGTNRQAEVVKLVASYTDPLVG